MHFNDFPRLTNLKLTAREVQCLGLYARGETVKDIAVQLNLSVKTVSTYLLRIRKKAGLADTDKLRVAAVLWLIET